MKGRGEQALLLDSLCAPCVLCGERAFGELNNILLEFISWLFVALRGQGFVRKLFALRASLYAATAPGNDKDEFATVLDQEMSRRFVLSQATMADADTRIKEAKTALEAAMTSDPTAEPGDGSPPPPPAIIAS